MRSSLGTINFSTLGLATLTTLAGASLGCSGAVASEETGSLDEGILNGTTLAEANSGIVKLQSSEPGGPRNCTGTLLKNKWVLTASHCVKLYLDRDWASGFDGLHTGSRTGTRIEAATVDSSGRLVLAGSTIAAGSRQFYMKRFTTLGAADLSFGNSGQGETVFDLAGSSAEYIKGITIMPDGRIVVAGGAVVPFFNIAQVAVARFTANGIVDFFGTFGATQTDIVTSTTEAGTGVAVDSLGRPVVSALADTGTPNQYRFTVLRYTTTGQLDTTFGAGAGYVSVNPSNGTYAFSYGVRIDSNGKILLYGNAPVTGGAGRTALVRLNSDGTPDNTFDGDGKVVLTNSTGAQSMIFQGTKLLVGAFSPTTTPAVVRLNSNGSVDTTFGTQGISQPLFWDSTFGNTTGLALAADGRIRVGVAVDTQNNGWQFGYTTLTADGGLTPDRIQPQTHGIEVQATSTLAGTAFAASGDRVFVIGTQDYTSESSRAQFVILQPDRTFDDTFVATISGTMASDLLGADKVYLSSSNDDVALLHFPTGFTMNGSSSNYTFPGFFTNFTALVGTNVICKGYGNNAVAADGGQSGAGTLRTGTSLVTSLTSQYVKLGYVPGVPLPQLPLKGDSGSSCTSGNLITSVDSRGNGTQADTVRASRFSAWATQQIANP